MTIRRFHPMSLAKVAAFFYGIFGLLLGAFLAVLSLLGAGMGKGIPFGGAIFGIGAIIILPICYAIIGFIGSLIFAGLFNVAAKAVGGVIIDAE